MDELKPCPFCGDDAELQHHRERFWWVACLSKRCEINPRTEWETSRADAVEKWNNRAERATGVHAVENYADNYDIWAECDTCDWPVADEWAYCPHCGGRVAR